MQIKTEKRTIPWLIRFPIIESESLGGHARRMKGSSLHCGHTALASATHGYRDARINFCLPSNLPVLKMELSDAVPEVSEMRDHHTLFPLTALIGGAAHRQIFERHSMGKPQKNALLWRGGQAPGKRWSPGFCLQCIADDRESYDTSIWRREHLLTLLTLCPHHGEHIYDYCGDCSDAMRHSYVLEVPGEACCGKDLQRRSPDATKDERALGLSRFVLEILTSNETNSMTGERFARAVQVRAGDLGLSSGGKLRLVETNAHLDRALDKHARARLPNLATSSSFRDMLAGRRPFTNVDIALSVGFAMFGSVSALVSAVDATSSETVTTPRRAADKIDARYARLTDAERDAVTQGYVNRFRLDERGGDVNREQLGNEVGSYVYKWLLRYAHQYLPPKRMVLKPRPFAERRKSPILISDTGLAKYIKKRAAQLLAAGFMARISARVLMDGYPGVSAYSRRKHRLPLATTALAKYSETHAEWRLRITFHVVSEAKLCGIPVPKKAEVTKLSSYQMKRLCERLRKVIREKA